MLDYNYFSTIIKGLGGWGFAVQNMKMIEILEIH